MSIKKSFSLFMLLCFALPCQSFALYTGDTHGQRPLPALTRLIVKFRNFGPVSMAPPGKVCKSGHGRSGLFADLAEADAINKKYGVAKVAPFLRQQSPQEVTSEFKNIVILTARDGVDISAMQAEYEKLPYVEYAEPDYLAEFFVNPATDGYESPNDSLYPQQWGLNNTGQSHYHILRLDGPNNDQLITVNGLSGADIHADEVFQNPPDNTESVIVAIIDTGADMLHPDLAENIWVNPREISENGLDDDNNGYVDDVHGWDFCGNGGFGSTETGGDNDPTDQYGHGTHCSGIVAGVTNNLIGIAGIIGKCKIMPLKIDPLPLTTYIAGALIYAADNGADVVNMSFGFTFRSHLIEEALNYASSKGVILCTAAGNDFTEQINYPAGYQPIIAVGASTDSDQVASFSTYGNHIDVVAPGHSILSLRAAGTDMYGADYPREPHIHIIDTLYYLASGTSMACPHVVGVAAWLRSISPGLTPDAAEKIIQETADDIIDPYGVGWNLPGKDKYSGYGRINLSGAIHAVPKVRARIDSPSPFQILSGDVEISGIADGAAFTGYILEYGIGTNPTIWTKISSSISPVTGGLLGKFHTFGLSGLHTFRLRVGADNMSCVSVYIANETSVQIQSPSANDTIANSITISGNAYSPDFGHLILEYGMGPLPEKWDTITQLSTPIYQSSFAGWIIEDIPAGDYTLRLSVYSRTGDSVVHSIPVCVKSIFTTDRAWKIDLAADPTIIPNYGDFDNDGNNEIVVGASSGVKFFNSDGTPKTEGMPVFPTNNYAIPIAVGNLDGDGIDDIVAVGYDPPKIYGFPSHSHRFENYLGALPGITTNLVTENELPKVFLEDIDHDGQDEIHVILFDYDLPKIFLFESDGALKHEFDHYGLYLPANLDRSPEDEIYVCNQDYGLLKKIRVSDFATLDSLIIQKNGSTFFCMDLSACDINNDHKLELIAFGYFRDYGYWLYAFDDDLQAISGWPRSINADDFVVPTNPTFADIDGDGELEYFTTYFDFGTSYVLAWNLDGSPCLAGSTSGLFAVVPGPSILNMLLAADMNGDKFPELVACAMNDMFLNYPVQRIYCWDKDGKLLDGYPLIGEMGNSTYLRYTPVIGDINRDGKVDLIMTTADSSLVFFNFPESNYDPCSMPAPFWRYGREMNNIVKAAWPCGKTNSGIDGRMPNSFVLLQNYPNPFNSITRIDFSIPNASNVTINIYNILGQKICTPVNDFMTAGKHAVYWDGKDAAGHNNLASGLYFYRMETANYSEDRKMLLLK